jgi:hypothetical protein
MLSAWCLSLNHLFLSDGSRPIEGAASRKTIQPLLTLGNPQKKTTKSHLFSISFLDFFVWSMFPGQVHRQVLGVLRHVQGLALSLLCAEKPGLHNSFFRFLLFKK